MLFRAQPGVIWFDIVMSKQHRNNLRRHLIKLHPRNDQIIVVRSAMQVSFLQCEDDIHKRLTEEYVRRNSHELTHFVLVVIVVKNGD